MFKRFFLLLGTLTLFNVSQAQTYDTDYTVDYINERLSDVCKIFSERKNLRIEYYSNGEPVRIDYIFPSSIDFENGILYSTDEQAVVIGCYEKAGRCIEREILKHGRKILYDRTNLEAKCEGDECEALATAVQHLIKLYVLDDYERTQPFEEK